MTELLARRVATGFLFRSMRPTDRTGKVFWSIASTSRTTSSTHTSCRSRTFHTAQSHHAQYRRFGDPRQESSPGWLSGLPTSNRPGFPSPMPQQQQQGPPRSQRYYDNRTRLGFFGILVAGGGLYYVSHLERVPQTGRWRFLNVSVEQEQRTAEMGFQQVLQQYRGRILSPNHPASQLAHRVAVRILQAAAQQEQQGHLNAQHLPSDGLHHGDLSHGDASPSSRTEWEVFVVQDSTPNAFVLPNGKIFVMTGILPICSDEDGLATVLGHEMAHQIVRHGAEKMSNASLITWLAVGLDALIGTSFGLSRAGLTLLMDLPNSRVTETEADHIGLRLMSAACYDPQAAPKLWQRMVEFEGKKGGQGNALAELISTHPVSSKRIVQLEEWMPEAQKIRREAGCPAPGTVARFRQTASRSPLGGRF